MGLAPSTKLPLEMDETSSRLLSIALFDAGAHVASVVRIAHAEKTVTSALQAPHFPASVAVGANLPCVSLPGTNVRISRRRA
jgi:hypothetical protein